MDRTDKQLENGSATQGSSPAHTSKGTILKALKAAFPHTLPIFAGFWFLSLAYGIYMNISDFSFVYPMIMSFVIFGGSLEFIAVSNL